MSLKRERETNSKREYLAYKKRVAIEKKRMLEEKQRRMPLTKSEKAYLQAINDIEN